MNKSAETSGRGSNTQAKLVGLVVALCLSVGLVGMLVARWASPRLDGAEETLNQILPATQLDSTELDSTELDSTELDSTELDRVRLCDGSEPDGLVIEMADPELFRRGPMNLSNIEADRAEVRFTELRPEGLPEEEEFDPTVVELTFSRRSNNDWCLSAVELD